MNGIYLNIAGFIICALVILISGSKLSKYGDMMADVLGWGKMFMGLILMASVTSLPELITGISSVVIVDAPDLAVGDIVGSCAFNILIISIMDMFYNPKKPLTSIVQQGHVIAASFGIIMLGLVAVAILMPGIFGRVAWIGGYSLLFITIYLVAIRVLFLYEKKQHIEHIFPSSGSLTLKQVIARYSVHAGILMVAAMALPFFGKALAAETGLGQSLFGTLFMAASTSLPEIVISVAAIRIGAINLAIGNIFGSNIFNIGILALDDMLYIKGPILLYTSPNHIIPVIGTIIITAIGITGIVFRAEKKWKLALDTAFILLVFVLMMFVLFHRTNIDIP